MILFDETTAKHMDKKETEKAIRDWMISFKPVFLGLLQSHVSFIVTKKVHQSEITIRTSAGGKIQCSFTSPHGNGYLLYEEETEISSLVYWLKDEN